MRPYAKRIGVLRHDGWTMRELYQIGSDQPDGALIAFVRGFVKYKLERDSSDGPIKAGFYLLYAENSYQHLLIAQWDGDGKRTVIVQTQKHEVDTEFQPWCEFEYPFTTVELIVLGIEAAIWEAHFQEGSLRRKAWANAPHALIA